MYEKDIRDEPLEKRIIEIKNMVLDGHKFSYAMKTCKVYTQNIKDAKIRTALKEIKELSIKLMIEEKRAKFKKALEDINKGSGIVKSLVNNRTNLFSFRRFASEEQKKELENIVRSRYEDVETREDGMTFITDKHYIEPFYKERVAKYRELREMGYTRTEARAELKLTGWNKGKVREAEELAKIDKDISRIEKTKLIEELVTLLEEGYNYYLAMSSLHLTWYILKKYATPEQIMIIKKNK